MSDPDKTPPQTPSTRAFIALNIPRDQLDALKAFREEAFAPILAFLVARTADKFDLEIAIAALRRGDDAPIRAIFKALLVIREHVDDIEKVVRNGVTNGFLYGRHHPAKEDSGK